MDEFSLLSQACQRLGASPSQAGTMARQLLKRADQLAVERGISREAALEYLLKLVVSGRSGSVDSELLPPHGSKDDPPAHTE